MGGIFYFLVIAAILVISYSRQAKRSKGTPQQPDYSPDGDLPQRGSGSGHPYPEALPPFLQPAKPAPKKYMTTLHTDTATRRVYTPVKPASDGLTRRSASAVPPQQQATPQSPYAFHSVEEVRRAFIWMEILQRKY
ncbi:MAG: hypothetical protein LUB83_02910 [Prevotellaceae bacterium]|nr:hypothetical protein [Prevotellaceae bacterium]